MAGDGTQFSIGIGVSGAADVESAADATARLTSELSIVESASLASSEAVKAGEASYRAAEKAADNAAKALEKIGIAADAQRGKLQTALDAGDASGAARAAANLQKLVDRQVEAATKASAATAAMNSEAAALDKLKAAAGEAEKAEKKVGESLDAAKKAQAAAEGSGKVNEIAEGFGKLGGPLGQAGQKLFGAAEGFKKLTASLGAAGPYVAVAIAIVAIVAAVVAVTAAAAAGVATVGAWAVQLADANRTQTLLSAGIAHSVSGGELLDTTIANLGSQVPQTREELLSMADGLAKTGLRGKELSAALETAALKAAELKYGPDFQRQTLSIGNQVTRLKTNISGVFGGLQIEPLLQAMSKLVDLFDSTSVTGQAIKIVFESLFQPLIDGVTAFVPKVIKAFINFEILVLQALIAIKPFGSKIELLGEAFAVLAGIIVGILTVAVVAFLAPFAALAAGATLGIAAFLSLADTFRGLGAAITNGAGAALLWLQTKLNEAVAYLSSISLSEIGANMIAGLAAGITGAAGAVLSSITGVVGGAIDAAKGLLKINSPSKVFAEIGASTGEGMVGGVEGSTSGVQSALETMVSPPEAAPAAAPAPTAKSGEGGSAASLAGLVMNFFGVEGAKDAQDRFVAALEALAAQGGKAVPSA